MTDPERPSGRPEADPSDPVLAEWVEELNRKLQAGEPVDIEAYALEHPERAEQLRRLLPAIAMMADLGRSLAPDSGTAAPAGADAFTGMGVLGDYRIVREIGRGGMGVVYEARQVSLGRRVALKVLPFASALDPRQLQRFHIEAQAAACLHHANIVPVHAVGSEHGVGYYAMQYVEGRNLAEVIRELRLLDGLDPAAPEAPAVEPGGVSFDLASGLFDPKPTSTGGDTSTVAHSTRTPDAEGDPVTTVPARVPSDAETVMPGEGRPPTAPPPQPAPASATGHSSRTRAFFRTAAHLGLQAAEALDHAHEEGVLHRDIKPANLLIDGRGKLWVTDFGLARMQHDAGMTMTGDLLGTLRYMSPEQALAKRVVIDGRTDVYSLGVTLYELLTLHPVLDGRDRADLLRRIAQEEPRPLRRLNPAVPADLETIVLKAMAKEVPGRYATARELADDLRRFLDGQPIQARRPSVLDRAAKWSRRHKAAVATAAVLLVLAVVGLAASTVLVGRERDEARRQRERAEANFRKARDAVDQMLTEVAEKKLAQVPQMEPVRRVLLEKALAFYQGFARERSTDPTVRGETARAYVRVGHITKLLGRRTEAERAFRQAIALTKRLMTDFPATSEYRSQLVKGLYDLGHVQAWDGRQREAETSYREALAVAEALTAEFPANVDYRALVTECLLLLSSSLHALGRFGEAEQVARRGIALMDRMAAEFPGYRRGVVYAGCLQNLALLLKDQRRFPEAEQADREAVRLFEEWVAESPDPIRRSYLATCQRELGSLLEQNGRARDAEAAYRACLGHYKALAALAPAVPLYRRELAASYDTLGDLLSDTGRAPEAEVAYRTGLDLLEKLTAENPADSSYREDAARIQIGLGGLLVKTRRHPEAEAAYRRALEILEPLAAASPANPGYRTSLAEVHRLLGELFESTHRSREAEAATPRKVEELKKTP